MTMSDDATMDLEREALSDVEAPAITVEWRLQIVHRLTPSLIALSDRLSIYTAIAGHAPSLRGIADVVIMFCIACTPDLAQEYSDCPKKLWYMLRHKRHFDLRDQERTLPLA
jgi:hypothetical protein